MADKPYYKYLGPLDPGDPQQVCNDREEDVNKIIQVINMNEYWTILGPRQSGKTTFLRLIKKEYKQADYIYFDFEKTHSTEKEFYQELINQFLKKIPKKIMIRKLKSIKGDSPAMSFFEFLINFKPKKERKVILLFDEIDGLPFLESFLHLWRKVYHDRLQEKGLNRYIVITTGSVELVKLVMGKNSPFNIAQKLYLKDFSEEESKHIIIEEPFAKLDIQIEPTAKQELLSQMCGHPQLLQHACHILVEKANKSTGKITKKHVDEAIVRLLRENSSLETLKRDILSDETLKKLVHDLLKEKKQITFHPYTEYSLLGAGAIKEDENSLCKIRNPVYERCINDILENPVIMPAKGKKDYHETMKAKADEKDQLKNSRRPQPERRGRKLKNIFKLKNILKFLIAVSGILAIFLLYKVTKAQDTLDRFWLILGSGISAAVTLGGLSALPSGDKNESSIKNN